jgi:AcrR family transcriptional regulator
MADLQLDPMLFRMNTTDVARPVKDSSAEGRSPRKAAPDAAPDRASGGTRRYDGRRRRAASAESRHRILEVARRLFVEQGYRATTVAAIAREAGVHADTVYALVGRKATILRELLEQAISGTDRAVPAEDRDHVRAIRAEPDPTVKLSIYARAVATTHPRLAPLVVALGDAASTDPGAAAVWREISDRRAANMRRLARDLRSTGRLRAELPLATVADTLWATNSPELYVLLTGDRGWSNERYERWLADTWCRLLLT